MEFDEEIFDLARRMSSLGISEEHRSRLIRRSCTSFGKAHGYSENLQKGLKKAAEERFFGHGAYRFLVEYQKNYYNSKGQ